MKPETACKRIADLVVLELADASAAGKDDGRDGRVVPLSVLRRIYRLAYSGATAQAPRSARATIK